MLFEALDLTHPWHLLSLGVGLWMTGKIVYNIYFHPLANVPGPFWARATSIPSWLHARSGKRHIWLWQQFQIYGTRVRVEPDTVLFCDPAAYADIYNMKANVRRSKFYTALQRRHDQPNTLTTIDVAAHTKRRNYLNIAFTEKLIREASVFVQKHVDRWNELLITKTDTNPDTKASGEWTSPVLLSDSLDALIFDIMGDLIFGKSFEIKEPGENELKKYPLIISKVLQHAYTISRSPLIDTILFLKPYGLDAMLGKVAPPAIKAYHKFTAQSVAERFVLQEKQNKLPEAERRKDVFYFLHNAKDPDTGLKGLSKEEIAIESSLFVIAGSDTTAISLSSIFFYLTGNPRTLHKLEAEILGTFETAEDIVRGPKLAGCVYLRACVDEGMRLTPAGPSEPPREVLAGGIKIKGQFYPAGTIVGTSSWVDSRNQEVYGDPEIYRPERWIIEESSKEEVARIKANFHPFAAGPGMCVAGGLAISEILLTVARTLHRFEVRRVPGSTLGGGHDSMGWGARDAKQMQVIDAYASIRQGPEVQFRSRAR